MTCTSTLAMAFSLSLLSCEDKKNRFTLRELVLSMTNYELVRAVLENGLAAMQVDVNDD